MWITEGTYDKEYVETHTVGFDKIKAYVLGEEDGIPKTPAWASEKCGVPEWTIKALARDWAKKTVTIGHYFGGGMARGPYSTEPARLEVVLLGMQGLGKPGVHQAQIAYTGMPRNIIDRRRRPHGDVRRTSPHSPAGDRLLKPHKGTPTAWGKQMVPKTLIEKAIKNGTGRLLGHRRSRGADRRPVREVHLSDPQGRGRHRDPHDLDRYPLPHHLLELRQRRGRGDASPKIEFIVAQHPWLENDIVLRRHHPADQHHSRSGRYLPLHPRGRQLPERAPHGQAISADRRVQERLRSGLRVAKKLGMDEEVTEGFSVEDLVESRLQGHEVRRARQPGRSSRRRTTA